MKKIIISFLLLLPLLSFCGGIKIQLQSGLGTYSMTDMKLLDGYLLRQISLPVQQTENFPAYWFYQGSILFEISNELSFGPTYAFHSTGSRHSLADYSGEYFLDDLVHTHTVGLTCEYVKATQNNLKWGAYMEGGISFTKARFTEHLELAEIEDKVTNNSFAKETSYFIEPGIRLGYPLKRLEPGLHVGYCISLAGKGLKEDESGELLYLPNGNKVKSSWNGLRIGLSISILLNKKN